ERQLDGVELHLGRGLERYLKRGTLLLRELLARVEALVLGVELAEVLGDELYRLERIVTHRSRRDEPHDARDARRALARVPSGIAPGLRIGGDDQYPLDLPVVDLAEDAPRAVLAAQRDIGTAQTDIVREPAVEQMDVGSGFHGVAIRDEVSSERHASRLVDGLERLRQPGRGPKAVARVSRVRRVARVVVERHRAQQNREGGR